MKEYFLELFSDVDGLSPSEVMGFVAGIAGIVLAFLQNNQAATVLAFSAGCFGVNKAASAAIKTSQSKAMQPQPTQTQQSKDGPPISKGKV